MHILNQYRLIKAKILVIFVVCKSLLQFMWSEKNLIIIISKIDVYIKYKIDFCGLKLRDLFLSSKNDSFVWKMAQLAALQ